MASGKSHAKATVILGILLAFVSPWYPWLPVGALLGLWLSPDLDTVSDPYRMWGVLRFVWWPYQKFFAHRSFWTHFPVVGTLGRVLYLSPFILVAWQFIGLRCFAELVVGLCLADLLHYLMDLSTPGRS